jgi:hypothetical protein
VPSGFYRIANVIIGGRLATDSRDLPMENLTFESIESAQQFIALLIESVNDSRKEIDSNIAEAGQDKANRRREALLLVAYQLNLLATHLVKSSRILNDLRSLRRLLLTEPDSPPSSPPRSRLL